MQNTEELKAQIAESENKTIALREELARVESNMEKFTEEEKILADLLPHNSLLPEPHRRLWMGIREMGQTLSTLFSKTELYSEGSRAVAYCP